MTDLEITKLCAEAMEISGLQHTTGDDFLRETYTLHAYDPLHDDAQAMALVKKMNVHLEPPWTGDKVPSWEAYIESDEDSPNWIKSDPDLNRAICECVAKMQLEKEKQK